MMDLIRRFTKYGIVAAGSAVADWTVFSVLTLAFDTYYIHAQMASRIAGGVFSFVSNKYWSFDSSRTRRTFIEGRRFLLLYVLSYCLSLTFLFVLSDIVGLHPFLAKLITDSACLVVNFLTMQGYVFHSRKGVGALVLQGLEKIRRTS